MCACMDAARPCTAVARVPLKRAQERSAALCACRCFRCSARGRLWAYHALSVPCTPVAAPASHMLLLLGDKPVQVADTLARDVLTVPGVEVKVLSTSQVRLLARSSIRHRVAQAHAPRPCSMGASWHRQAMAYGRCITTPAQPIGQPL